MVLNGDKSFYDIQNEYQRIKTTMGSTHGKTETSLPRQDRGHVIGEDTLQGNCAQMPSLSQDSR